MKNNIRLINIHGICTNMLFLLPVIVPYYQSIGLTFRDFLIGEAAFSAVVLFSEVPSGWISDVWKRRSTMVLGAFFGLAGYATLLLAHSFWQATLAQGIIGIAVALNSGTNTALLYDSLFDMGRIAEYRRLEGNRHAYGIYGTGFSCLLGAILFTVDPKLPLILDMTVLIIAMVTIARVVEPARHKTNVEKHIFHDMWVTVKYALSGHPEITGIILVSTVVMCTSKLMLWVQQPYFTLTGIPVEWFGVIMAGGYAVSGMASYWSHRIEHWGSNRMALGVMGGILALSCLILVVFQSAWLAVPLFLTGTLTYAVGTPRINNAINSRVGSERRATILSTASLMVHMVFIPTSLIVGYISDHGSILGSLLWMSGQLTLLGAIGLWLWNRNPE